MRGVLSVKSYKSFSWLLGLLLLALLLAYVLYSQAEIKLRHEAVLQDKQETKNTIGTLVQAQQQTNLLLAQSLAENPIIEELLQRPQPLLRQKLSQLTANLNNATSFKDIWVQLVDIDGRSVYRSWTEKVGDNLLPFRPEIGTVFETRRSLQNISVGRFTISFKTMTPVISDDGTVLGMVDIVTQFTPLTQKLLNDAGVETVLLVDKRFQSVLTRALTGKFIDGYYVANENASKALLEQLYQGRLQAFLETPDYTRIDGYVVSVFPIKSEDGVLAYWLAFKPYDAIDFSQVNWVLQKYVVISIGVILLVLLLAVIIMSRSHAEAKKRYYRQIINSVSDVIYISNGKQVVDANAHFFELFDEFENLETFLKRYQCVCEVFEREEGFLQPTMNGMFWLDYVLMHPNERHKAKIVHNGVPQIFLIKVKTMMGLSERLYNVLMQDITQIEHYEQELKKLSVTDELTGAGNRLACNQAMEKEINRSRRYLSTFSVILYDLDFFKKINDTFGHDVGDTVLVEVTAAVRAALRDTDVLCRYGGEEFLVILPQTPIAEALQTAERLRSAVESLSREQVPVPLTSSFGVAELTRWDTGFTLLKRVDRALYQAKEQGRNRVEMAEEVLGPQEN
nr:diguanylate cyclase [Thiomicrorhabdus cannonii]